MPKIENRSIEAQTMLMEYLVSNESIYCHFVVAEKERDDVFEKLKNDIDEKHHDLFEKYDDGESVLLYVLTLSLEWNFFLEFRKRSIG